MALSSKPNSAGSAWAALGFAALNPTYGDGEIDSALLELLQALPGFIDHFLALAVLHLLPSFDLGAFAATSLADFVFDLALADAGTFDLTHGNLGNKKGPAV
ncbi:hypothetical protein J2W58_000356 [Pseudomonas psychrotolerans]|nr:hypothetical protein [Pseudomonas psychrotolerans]